MSKGYEYPFSDALEIGQDLMKGLVGVWGDEDCSDLAIVGSLRRGESKVRDIDFLCIGNPEWIEGRLEAKGYEIDSSGEKRIIAKDTGGTGGYVCTDKFGDYRYLPNVNVFFTEKDSWGAALMHTTGPSRYNIRKRNYLKKHMPQVYKLNEYGLYNEEGFKIAGTTEEGIYKILGWDYCPPHRRK